MARNCNGLDGRARKPVTLAIGLSLADHPRVRAESTAGVTGRYGAVSAQSRPVVPLGGRRTVLVRNQAAGNASSHHARDQHARDREAADDCFHGQET